MDAPSYFTPEHTSFVDLRSKRGADYQQWWKASQMCQFPVETVGRGGVSRFMPCNGCAKCYARQVATGGPPAEYIRACERLVKYSRKAWFITLTLSDKKLKRSGLQLADANWTWARNYVRRLTDRRSYDTVASVAWTGCMEYGEQHGRPHFHLLLGGREDLTKRIIQSHWRLGRSKVGIVREAANVGAYLGKYMTKASRVKSCRHFRSGYAAAAISYPDIATAFETAIAYGELDALAILGERDPKVGFALSRALGVLPCEPVCGLWAA